MRLHDARDDHNGRLQYAHDYLRNMLIFSSSFGLPTHRFNIIPTYLFYNMPLPRVGFFPLLRYLFIFTGPNNKIMHKGTTDKTHIRTHKFYAKTLVCVCLHLTPGAYRVLYEQLNYIVFCTFFFSLSPV